MAGSIHGRRDREVSVFPNSARRARPSSGVGWDGLSAANAAMQDGRLDPRSRDGFYDPGDATLGHSRCGSMVFKLGKAQSCVRGCPLAS